MIKFTICEFKLDTDWSWTYFIKGIIERYEGVTRMRNLDGKSTEGEDENLEKNNRANMFRQKSVIKGLQMEFILNRMTDQGIIRMFDQCSEEFFVALKEELGMCFHQPLENYSESKSKLRKIFRKSEFILS